ncbi:hypothetical protein F0562_007615 [Nyssa sinensis]|uniref:Uncharacterized protein n=1 Tax=Nyssa sinensis TaxID=561372 RepID=A0A5J5A3U2_9ASTE|nr:hypothetical protein F0562_007615 [Nyssa sinensis]
MVDSDLARKWVVEGYGDGSVESIEVWVCATATLELEERRADWEYPKPVVICDMHGVVKELDYSSNMVFDYLNSKDGIDCSKWKARARHMVETHNTQTANSPKVDGWSESVQSQRNYQKRFTEKKDFTAFTWMEFQTKISVIWR